MAYTRAWTDTTPADVDQASTLGAAIRNLRTDIEERMNTLTSNGWDSDPVAGFPLTKVKYLPPIFGSDADGTSGHSWFYQDPVGGSFASMSPLVTASLKEWMVPLILPVGCTLTKIRAVVRKETGAAGGSTIRVGAAISTQVTTQTSAQIGTFTTSPAANSTFAYVDLAIASHLMAAQEQIVVYVQSTVVVISDCKYGGLEVTYTVPDLLTTL